MQRSFSRCGWITVFLGCWLATSPASAKSERTANYSAQAVWSPAVRFIRIDEGLTITDKDQETGYIVFEIKDGNKVYRGSLEIIAGVAEKNQPTVRLVVSIAGRPLHSEIGLLDRLVDKLFQELGDSTPPPKPAPAPAKPTPAPPPPK